MNSLLPLLAAALAFAASPLAGTWNKDGSTLAVLNANGTGVVRGEAVAWKASGATLTLVYESGETEALAYKLAGDKLTVTMAGQSETYVRAGANTAAPAKAAKAPARAEAPAKAAGNDSLSKMLMSSAWCYFRYNQAAGTTNQERVVFRADGTWASGSQAETYSSGMHGTASGQSNSAAGGRWETKWGGRLLMSEGRGALEDVGLSMTKNSNGYPILNAGGKEYSQCK